MPLNQGVAPACMVLKPPRPVDERSDDSLEAEFEEWAVMDFEQPVRDMDAEIRVDPDQLGVKGRVMELRQR